MSQGVECYSCLPKTAWPPTSNSPQRIRIHCIDNCRNKELVETIKNVFLDRVECYEECNICIKSQEKIKF